MASKMALRDARSGRSRKWPRSPSRASMLNSVSTQNTKSRSCPKFRYVVVRTAAETSTTRLGTDGSSSMPMNSDSAFMYAPDRMLPHSLRQDCSMVSKPVVVPSGRLSSMSHTLRPTDSGDSSRSEEHTSELQSLRHLVCRLLLEKKKNKKYQKTSKHTQR